LGLIVEKPRVPTTSVDGVIVVWDISTKQTNKQTFSIDRLV